MATLYLARRHGAAGFSRLVALKVVHPHLIELPAVVEMFVDEARICAQLAHPNIVHVEEFGQIDGVHYLVMEYLDGCSVGDLLQTLQDDGRKLDPELAARIVMQVAGGLHAAHETRDAEGRPLDIVHRDISPSNILLAVDGNAKLIDFGIAKARYRLAETEAGVSLKGKFNYVAPEQATRTAMDRRSDIFALGVVFWELLTGRPLFAEDTYLALFNRLNQTDVVAPSQINPGAPAVLDPIVLAMLSHAPADRPQTAADVVRRIAAALPGAANREASELGALATEVRDRRAQGRTPDEQESASHISFSPVPRSPRTHAEEYRLKIDSMTGIHAAMPMPVARAPLWRRRGVQLGLASMAGCVAALSVLLVRTPETSSANASTTAGHATLIEVPATEAPGHGDVPSPMPTTTPSAPPPRGPAPAAMASAEPVAAPVMPGSSAPALPSSASPVNQAPVAPTTPAMVAASGSPIAPGSAPAGSPPAVAVTTPVPPTATTPPARPAAIRHDPPRVVARPARAPGTPAVEPAAIKPLQAASANAIHAGDATIVTTPFDDADNTSSPSAPSSARPKQAPTASEPGN